MKFPMNEHSINQFWNSTNTVVTVTVVTNISISRSYYKNNEKWYIYFYLTFIYINKPKKYPSWYKTRYKEKLLLAWIKNRNLHPEFIHTFMETWFQVSASHCPSIWKRFILRAFDTPIPTLQFYVYGSVATKILSVIHICFWFIPSTLPAKNK